MNYKLCLMIGASLMMGCSTNKSVETSRNQLEMKPSSSQGLVVANSASEYEQLAKRYEDKHNLEMAAIAYQKALRLEANRASSLSGLAMTYAKQDLLSVAIPLFEKAVALQANAKHYNNLGYAYYMNKQYQQAHQALTQAIAMDVNHTQAINNLALVMPHVGIVPAEETIAVETISLQQDLQAVSVEGMPDLPQSVSTDIEIVKDSATTHLVEKTNAVYELTSPVKAEGNASHTDIQHTQISEESAINLTTTQSEKSTTASMDMVAMNSGGINFKHGTVISKLFDATNTAMLIFQSSNTHWIEVLNGNGLKGVARSVSTHFTQQGVTQIRARDAKSFNVARTHIQYRTGYRDDAVALNHHLRNKPMLYRNDQMPPNVSVRLVLGRDVLSAEQQALVDSVLNKNAT